MTQMPPLPNSKRLKYAPLTMDSPVAEASSDDLHNPPKFYSIFNRQSAVTAPVTFRLLDLPAEIRKLIYELLFAGTKLMVDYTSGHQVTIECENSQHDYHSLLRTCKSIRAEAMPILAHNTTLVVQRNLYRRTDPQKLNLSALWKSRLRKIEYDTSPNLMFRLEDLSNLKSVVLEPKVYHLDSVWEKAMGDIEMFVARKVRKAKRLADKGFHGLKEGDGVEVTLKTWILNTKLRTTTASGLEVIFDVRN